MTRSVLESDTANIREAGGKAALAFRRMEALACGGDRVRTLFADLKDTAWIPAGGDLVKDHEPPRPRFLVSGWAARVRVLADGRRQIINLVLPGDSLGVCDRPRPIALVPVTALTAVETVSADAVVAAIRAPSAPAGLAGAFHKLASLDEACLIDQIVRLGRQTAFERLAHLLLEIRQRLQFVGLEAPAGDDTYPFPLTQDHLADATGLSIVHVNRTLQHLRRDGLLDIRHGQLRVFRPVFLASLVDYHPPSIPS